MAARMVYCISIRSLKRTGAGRAVLLTEQHSHCAKGIPCSPPHNSTLPLPGALNPHRSRFADIYALHHI